MQRAGLLKWAGCMRWNMLLSVCASYPQASGAALGSLMRLIRQLIGGRNGDNGGYFASHWSPQQTHIPSANAPHDGTQSLSRRTLDI